MVYSFMVSYRSIGLLKKTAAIFTDGGGEKNFVQDKKMKSITMQEIC